MWNTKNKGLETIAYRFDFANRLTATGVWLKALAVPAAALEPPLFSDEVSRQAMSSLGFLLETPVIFRPAPELFCLDLFKDFDIDHLTALAAPTSVVLRDYAPASAFKMPPPEPEV